jgi:hypothetical protein
VLERLFIIYLRQAFWNKHSEKGTLEKGTLEKDTLKKAFWNKAGGK